jgi:hypothetical protein
MNVFTRIKKVILASDRPPKWYDRLVNLTVEVKKGQQFGEVVIPCAIETLSHSIDLNPSLLSIKDKKEVLHIGVDEKYTFIEDHNVVSYQVDKAKKELRYNPMGYVLEITKEEKKQRVYMEEINKCQHCGRKEFVAKVEETKYKSCPSIGVKLAEPADRDLHIPVKFGLSTIDATVRVLNGITIPLLAIFFTWLWFFKPMVRFSNYWIVASGPSAYTIIATILLWAMSIGPGYRAFSLTRWWIMNRKNMTEVYTEPIWRKWVRGVFTI